MGHSLDDLGLHWLYLIQQKKHMNERRTKENRKKKNKTQSRKLSQLMSHAKEW